MLRYLLALSRPRFWLYLAGPVLVGVAYGASAPEDLVSPAAVALFAYFLVPANVFLYGVNDLFDADADAENPKKAGRDADEVGDDESAREVRYRGGRAVTAVVALCGLAGVALAAALASGALTSGADPSATASAPANGGVPGSAGGFAVPGLDAFAAVSADAETAASAGVTASAGVSASAGVAAGAWVLAFLALGYAYSAPPFRLKTTPPLDSVSNGLYVLPGAAAYVAVAGRQPPALALAGGWLWAMAMHTFSAVPDVDADRRAGLRTTATLLGERATLAYCAACWLLAAGAFALLDLRAGALLALYPLLAVGIAGTDVDVSRAYWWFPAVNAAVGMALTLGGLWGVVRG